LIWNPNFRGNSKGRPSRTSDSADEEQCRVYEQECRSTKNVLKFCRQHELRKEKIFVKFEQEKINNSSNRFKIVATIRILSRFCYSKSKC
jgi:hypothetical protein